MEPIKVEKFLGTQIKARLVLYTEIADAEKPVLYTHLLTRL
jgi:hypothetical protein